jgi:hypothetical protein
MQERYTTLRELSLVYLYPKEVDRGNFEDMGGCYRADELERKLGMIGDSYEWENKHRITV